MIDWSYVLFTTILSMTTTVATVMALGWLDATYWGPPDDGTPRPS